MIRTESRGRLLILSLDRPEKRNALDRALCEALLARLRQAGEDEAVAAVVVAGEGAGFCAGADLAEMRALAGDPEGKAARSALTVALMDAPAALPKPVVAAVHGAAMGAGASLALACDMVMLAEDARLAWPEAKHGMLPGLVAPVLLRQLPPKPAFELLATGRALDAPEALALRLANRIAPAAALREEACGMAEAAALLPPPAIEEIKRMVRQRGRGAAA
jgi:enoyl-CoA hydratase/carnithine racemase